ncbi:transposase [Streptomyces sp. ActVer]|nr:transposase [Streptomyces sp. ActVer]MCZ4509541.1 transposase [Streptomyces sp. ActVer]
MIRRLVSDLCSLVYRTTAHTLLRRPERTGCPSPTPYSLLYCERNLNNRRPCSTTSATSEARLPTVSAPRCRANQGRPAGGQRQTRVSHLAVQIAGSRGAGKSDPVDAHAAATAILSGLATRTLKSGDGVVKAIRVLRVVRRSAVKARNQTINQIRTLMVTTPSEVRDKLRDLSTRELIDTRARRGISNAIAAARATAPAPTQRAGIRPSTNRVADS